MTDDEIITQLRERAKGSTRRLDGIPNIYPVVTLFDIESAERELGLSLPSLLKRIYLEVGNGGCMLGPGYGLLGLPGGFDNDVGWNVVRTSLEMARDYKWWDGTIVVCDWGCTIMSCVDCSDDDFTVFRYDGNFVGESEDEPPDDAWYLEADTFAEWVLTPNCRATDP